MRTLAFVPIVVFIFATLVIAVRLLALARRSREFPEFAIGMGVVLTCAVGLPLTIAGRVPQTVATAFGDGCFAAGMLFVAAGITLFFGFTTSVFYAGARGARGVAAGAGFVNLSIAAAMVHAASLGSNLAEILGHTRPWAIALVAMLVLAFGWSGVESLRYFLWLRRRRALGLFDPIVANRFLLWAIAGLAVVVLAASIAGFLAAGRAVLVEPLALAVIAVCGVLMSLTWYLTFLAPAAYLRWLGATAPDPAAGGTA